LSQIPTDLRYSASHQWVAVAPDGSVAVGITDFAQEALGDIGLVEFPSLETSVAHDGVKRANARRRLASPDDATIRLAAPL
jgi:glycine cleavage system H lipoate-binding protein